MERHLPSPGLNRFHQVRFQRHRAGASTFLVALLDDQPVGVGEVRWNGCAAPEVRRRFPDCPELNGLAVSPQWQGNGVGTAIIAAAERLASGRGRRRLGLGVDDHNHRAGALYLRLGYQETGCSYVDRYPYLDVQGVPHEAADPCRFLVKPLRDGVAPTPPTTQHDRGEVGVEVRSTADP